jgi:hypothetical protein
MVVLCDDCSAAIADFARRHRVRVIGQPALKPAPAPADSSTLGVQTVTKPLSPYSKRFASPTGFEPVLPT